MPLATGRLIVSIEGTSLLEDEKPILAHKNTAGVILFARNFTDGNQLKKLVSDIQNTSIKDDLPIFADQEGGFVQRFTTDPFYPLPSFKEISKEISGTIDESSLAKISLYGQKLALSLSPFGIISLTPVVDLDLGNEIISGKHRSFSHDPKIVEIFTNAYIDGMKSIDHPATLKHFPGHGNKYFGKDDTHIDTPHDTRSYLEILQQDLQPFIQLHKKAEAIMPSHIIFDKIDPSKPCGFSNVWIQDILRNEIGFTGITVSDCLTMTAAGSKSSSEKALEALETLDIAILANVSTSETLQTLDQLGNKGVLSTERQHKFNAWTTFCSRSRKILGSYYYKNFAYNTNEI